MDASQQSRAELRLNQARKLLQRQSWNILQEAEQNGKLQLDVSPDTPTPSDVDVTIKLQHLMPLMAAAGWSIARLDTTNATPLVTFTQPI